MFHCIKWQHNFYSNIVPASNYGTMQHNSLWCSTRSTTLTCVKWTSLRKSDRDDHGKISLCHLILGSTDTHIAPTLAKFSDKLLRFSLAGTAQYVRLCSWCCMEGISLLITLQQFDYQFILICECALFGTVACSYSWQILIWSYSVAVLSQLYLAWIQEKVTPPPPHTHTLFCPICFPFL